MRMPHTMESEPFCVPPCFLTMFIKAGEITINIHQFTTFYHSRQAVFFLATRRHLVDGFGGNDDSRKDLQGGRCAKTCKDLCRPITKRFGNPQHCKPSKVNMLTGTNLQFVENRLNIRKASTSPFNTHRQESFQWLKWLVGSKTHQMASCLP